MNNPSTMPPLMSSIPNEPSPYASFQYQGAVSEPLPGGGIRQSGLGIASLILGILTAIMLFATICFAGYMEAATPGGMTDDSPILVLVGLFILAGMFGNFVGVILAAVGLAQKDRAKSVSVIGLCLNIMCLLGVVALMVLGTVAG